MRLPFTRLLRTTLLSSFAASILLLSSCTKNVQEQPAPALSTDQASVSELKRLYSEKQYDQQLPKGPSGATGYSWIPKWDALKWQSDVGSRYAFVPLEAKAAEGKTAIVLGTNHYLRFHQEKGRLDADLVTYAYKLPKGAINKLVAATIPSINTFTGNVFIKQLATGQTLFYAYKAGVWQSPASLSQAKQSDIASTNAAPGCTDVITCTWLLTCPKEWSGAEFLTATTTNFGGSCDDFEVRGTTLSCGGDTKYLNTGSTKSTVCTSPSPPGPYIDPYDPTDPVHPFSDGLCYIRSYNWPGNGFPNLGVEGYSTQPGALATQYLNGGSIWRLTFDSSDNTYTIQESYSGLMLDVQWGSTAVGAPIHIWPANGGTPQKWKIILVPGVSGYPNRVMIQSVHSGLVLQQKDGVRIDQAPIVQATPNFAISNSAIPQWWLIMPY